MSKRPWAWVKLSEDEIEKFASEYKDFLSKVKTERETAKFIIEKALENGFKFLNEYQSLKPNDKVIAIYKNKLALLAVIGKRDITEGLRIMGSHIDAPRIDLKPVPIFEDSGIAMFKTHYYGGIKKYQWVNIPLAIHGVVALKNGEVKEIVIGEDDNDPVFVISDLLPHLARKKQGERKGFDIVKGEELRILIGNKPLEAEKEDEKEKESVKKRILKILKDKYGIEEDDLLSADIEIVPAFKPRDVGFDRSMIASYGQDDRICAYTSLRAILSVDNPECTAIAIFADREEIGSDGNAGAKSRLIEVFIEELIEKVKGSCSTKDLLITLANSKAISADVNAAVNPTFKDVHDPQNAGYLGKGIIVTKYTGAGGKYGASEASAEYMAWIRKILDERGIPWQPGLLGKVDEGGGGTIAKFIAERGVDVVDAGPGIVGMHSPYEISSKADVYSAYLAYKAFYEAP
ncbi:MAG: aminopeptidase [Candidatus Njordarchaeia archaeon]